MQSHYGNDKMGREKNGDAEMKYTEFKIEHILALETEYGMRLYEILKSDEEKREYKKDDIGTMMRCEDRNEKVEWQKNWLDIAIRDINKNTDLEVEYEKDGEMIRFKVVKCVMR